MTLLQLDQVNYAYSSEAVGLDNVSFTLEKGSKVALMGANGSGKSTLFQTLAGILKPQHGHYLLLNKVFRYCRKYRRQLSQTIGYVFQDPDVQVVATHVYDDVAYGLRNKGMKEHEIKPRVEAYLDLVGISDLKDKAIHTLSYGQKKQVALAGVLVMEPQIILLDEPFAWLDYPQSCRLRALLNDLHQQGLTIVVSTHDSQFANEWAERILVMKKGQLAVDSSGNELFNDDELVAEMLIAPVSVRERESCHLV
ncbi:energy-coupling factor ABC transporter ATP-binding protein [Carboxylicivirga sp. M1479]|uniref:energy-coupling factor ABC transporter ATP-binding protein n=1 Tax=Carboxylicivirga sp. M1479 TaxID=2594476 RepID=UPI0011782939|nr:ABC transporter ATP-binding protein [Carboxylicivirga sp. M1479]TRX70227.1 ABC transporter ATP-binding protein [Carboxylicivirga sp. M1479]